MNYVESSYVELRKVSWPTRNQAVKITFLVLGFMIVMALAIGVLDFVFGLGHRALLDLGPTVAPIVTEEGAPARNTVNIGDATATTEDGGTVSVEPGSIDATPVDPSADASLN